jgi:hypothetical protein
LTVQALVRALQKRFPDASDDRAIDAAIRAHEDVTLSSPRSEMPSADVTIAVTTPNSEFTLTGLDSVDDARYNGVPLTYKTVEQLRANNPGWRDAAAGVPENYYVIGGNDNGELRIGIYPKPAASSNLLVWGPSARAAAWTTSNWTTQMISSLPGGAPVYLAVASWHLALQLRPAEAAYYELGRKEALVTAREQYRNIGGRAAERTRNA